MPDREVKLEEMLRSLIERGYKGDRKKIGRAVSISTAALSQYTLGRTRPSFEKLTALADFFGVSLDYLVYGEPVSVPLDHGPVMTYVQSAMAGVKDETKRHTDVMSRLGAIIVDSIDAAALKLAGTDTLGREGLIHLDEVMDIERYCHQADIFALHLGFNVIDTPDVGATPGRFLGVVAANVQKECRYRFLLPGNEVDHRDAVSTFRKLLTEAVGRDYAHEYCLFRRAEQPIVAGAAFYRVDTARFESERKLVYAQFSKYLSDDGWFGYVMEPSSDSNADMVMGRDHVKLARQAFDTIWSTGTPL